MIVVTGANGFIGSVMVWELNQRKREDLVCVDTVSLAERPGPLRHRHFKNFLLKDEIWAFLETPEAIAQVTGVVHMGACSSTTELNVAFLRENNFEYTQRLWTWCTKHGKTFIYASSGAVYGNGDQGFDDKTPSKAFKPLNPYGESKASFDRWVEEQVAAKAKMPPHWYGLRFFNVFGPNESHKEFMRSVAHKAYGQIRSSGVLSLFRSHVPEYEDGEQKRDFVYVKDITRWMTEMLEKPTIPSGIYNLGFGTARTWKDLAHAIFTAMDRPVNIEWTDIPEEMRPRYQYFTEAKIDRLLAAGLTKPEWPLEKAVADYVENYLSKEAEGIDAYL